MRPTYAAVLTAGCYVCDAGLGWVGIDRRRLLLRLLSPNLTRDDDAVVVRHSSAWSLQYCDVRRQKRPPRGAPQRRNFQPLFSTPTAQPPPFFITNVIATGNDDDDGLQPRLASQPAPYRLTSFYHTVHRQRLWLSHCPSNSAVEW